MTEVQNFMLVVCFGCTIGFLIECGIVTDKRGTRRTSKNFC